MSTTCTRRTSDPAAPRARAPLTRIVALLFSVCGVHAALADELEPPYPIVGQVTVYDEALHALVPRDARIEKIAEGYTWSEGPAWIPGADYLLFTDVPENTLYRWSEADGVSVFLRPSGYVGPELDTLREAGANGLFVETAGTVLLADSGSRLVARLDLSSRKKTLIASTFEGKRFNSPNDLVRRRDGAVFFTDPPYGLKDIDDSPVKELDANGVYRIDPDGRVHLLDATLRYPNGIALSPDERTLYVSNSDPAAPVWIAYALDPAGAVVDRRVFADASDLLGEGVPGLPDGMAVARSGHLFASGPGGVIVFDPDGKRLGRIETGSAVSNCTLGNDGRVLYMSSHRFIARVGLGASRDP